MNKEKKAIIIGAGPAGLTAAYELLTKTDIKPIIIEKTTMIGGISKTVNYKGNRIDLGGHRFFSKSDRVMKWWQQFFPVQEVSPPGATVEKDDVMLQRQRKSRIYFLRKFFDYPITLTLKTLSNLGLLRTIKIGFSYIKSVLFQIKPEKSLEDFFINRFGKELYNTFFKSYTEKLWGIQCNEISNEWGAQRVKGVSIWKTVLHAFKQLLPKKSDLSQKETETSLIEQFLYPKYGPGHFWEGVAKEVVKLGGTILFEHQPTAIHTNNDSVSSVDIKNKKDNSSISFDCDYFFSTMSIKDLVPLLSPSAPSNVQHIANGLSFRNFVTVGLLLDKLHLYENQKPQKDTWIYIQEPDVTMLRMQNFNVWSPYMVKDSSKTWIGIEYTCDDDDAIWTMNEKEMIEFTKKECVKIGIIKEEDLIDATVVRQEKTYPIYHGSYYKIDIVKNYLNNFSNMFLIGRNGMHRYNNMDHSMLSAMTAIENIINKVKTKDNLWMVNAEKDYHEEKSN
jgi:protoporphyrinogen oxidase